MCHYAARTRLTPIGFNQDYTYDKTILYMNNEY